MNSYGKAMQNSRLTILTKFRLEFPWGEGKNLEREEDPFKK